MDYMPLLWAICLVGLTIGAYWIYRITHEEV